VPFRFQFNPPISNIKVKFINIHIYIYTYINCPLSLIISHTLENIIGLIFNSFHFQVVKYSELNFLFKRKGKLLINAAQPFLCSQKRRTDVISRANDKNLTRCGWSDGWSATSVPSYRFTSHNRISLGPLPGPCSSVFLDFRSRMSDRIKIRKVSARMSATAD